MAERDPMTVPDGIIDLPVSIFDDNRGGLDKFFDPAIARTIGRDVVWRQALRSRTARPNTLRGLHAQRPPHSEAKLIVPLAGRMFWVCVDLRRDSPHFARWQGRTLDAAEPRGLFVERGFAHGCLSLTADVALLILADNDFVHEAGIGIAWNDRDLGIDWPQLGGPPALSDDHAGYAEFAEFRRRYGGL